MKIDSERPVMHLAIFSLIIYLPLFSVTEKSVVTLMILFDVKVRKILEIAH